MRIREFRLADYQAVMVLWKEAGISLSSSDSINQIKHKLQRDPELFIVAENSEHEVVGAVMGSYDGRRGWVNHLAVHPNFQGEQIGRKLLENLEQRLKQIGCEKLNLLIEIHNRKVAGFYEKLGFETDELIFMEKWLIE